MKRANCSSRSFKKSNESDLLTSLFMKTYRLQYFAVLRLFLQKNFCNLCPFSWQTSCFKFYKFFTIFIMSAGAVMPILHFIYFFSSICDEKLQNVTWKKSILLNRAILGNLAKSVLNQPLAGLSFQSDNTPRSCW